MVIILVSSLGFCLNTSGVNEQKTIASPPSSNKALDDQRSESLRQLTPSSASAGPIKVVYDLPVKQPVVFITIDDGWYPNEEVIKLMQQYHLPITTFLIEQAAQEHTNFWDEFSKAGGHIQDHTINHPYLTHLSLADKKTQISQPMDYFSKYNSPVDQLRPPYGDFNTEVGQAAWDSGIKYIVMWDAEMKNSILSTRSSQGLKSGDIILLHWVPGLDQELLMLLNILQKQNLGVADLTQALNGEPLTISWLKTPLPLPKPLPTGTAKAGELAGSSNNPATKNTPGTTGNTETTTVPPATPSPGGTVTPGNTAPSGSTASPGNAVPSGGTASPGSTTSSENANQPGNAGTSGTSNTPEPSDNNSNLSGA
ncbi:polysaccharide deacetylase family protein [Desulfosporosinus sp. PR]|uniref:polysaccharide deacetylase family protein n=1 Tax=Candidatus Desulfosporosinus nitrosoreducens TaxID=3401928 RepID=UPI0027FE548C|nr:polysaccharide deacetylase family protein [Desulfosporosinus sp. PR]MDQ7097160.1 polysaccharide deacetylase family protein [Desulfosporosinus sp. PR]